MDIFSYKQSRILAFLGVAVFLAVSVFGLSYTFGMEMEADGQIGDCLFVSNATICKMSLIEHISIWQGMLTAVPQKVSDNILSVVILIFATFFLSRYLQNLFQLKFVLSHQIYSSQHQTEVNLFDSLKQAFSQGILNPKIY